MSDYMETTAEKWLIDNGLNDLIISHPNAGEQYVQYVSDALKSFAKIVIDQTIESCDAHSDYDIDKDGVKVNVYRQFGIK